jgi:cytochrome c553
MMKSSLSVALLFLVACGGGQSQPATADSEGAAAPPPAAVTEAVEVPAAWSNDLSKEQKAAYMREKVAPRMTPVLQAFEELEGHKDAEVGCKTCHGPDWKLPKDHLPKLKMKGDKLTAFEEHPEAAKFMAEKVVPEMAAALGMQPYDPATQQGFGCAGCHAIEKE